MQRLRTLAPWLLVLVALGWAAAPYVSRDSLRAAAPVAAVVLAASLLLAAAIVLRRRHKRQPQPVDPQAALAARQRRALGRGLAAARRLRPTQTWLCLGLPGHGKTAVLTGAGPSRVLGEPDGSALRLHMLKDSRELLLEHPGIPCELSPLRAFRPRRPLDAILLVLALPDLLTSEPATLAAAVRPQLLGVLDSLAVDVPIYLICNKLDRFAGHAELVGDEREPWGFELADPAELPTRLQAWSQWVLAQRLGRLAGEPVIDRRARLFTLGAQFSRACDRLALVADALFTPHAGAPLRLRGVYFVAARPTTAPADGLLSELAANLHTRLRAVEAATGEPLATDLRPLFAALRRRAGEATRSPKLRRAAQRHAHVLAGALALVAAALAVTTLDAAARTHARLQSLADLGATLGAADPTPPLMALRAELDTWPAPTWSVRGLFTPAMREPLIAIYRRAARERLLAPIWRDLEAALAGAATHDQLRAYLLLTGCETASSDMSHEPCASEPEQAGWLRAELPRLADTDSPAELTLLLGTLLDHATADDLRFARDHGLVERTRTRLRALDDDEAVVLAALAAGDAACEPLTLRALTHAEQLAGAGALPCSFTRRGWPHVHTRLLRAAEHRDGWVLGHTVREHADAGRLARLRGRYEALYIAAWTDFLAGLRVRRPADLADAARLLAALTGDDRPLTRIFAALELHTRGLRRSDASLTHLLHGLDHPEHSAAIVRAFAPLLNFTIGAPDREAGLDRYHARLAELRDALEAARRDPADLPALQTQLDLAANDTHALLQHADLRRFRALLSGLLLPPLTALQASLRDQDKLALTAAYCSEVDAPLRRMISRYPFARTAHDELGLAEFSAFFHPETGAVRKFRDGRLAALLAIHGRQISARPTARSDEHPLAPGVLDLFTHAAELGDLAFPGGARGLDLEFDLHCNAHIGRVTLTVDGASHSYACGPDHRARMRWPGEGEPGARLELVGRDGRRETVPGAGPWGLWRLLEKDGLMLPPHDRTGARLVFRLDLAASRLGALDLAVTPPRSHGASLLFGDPARPGPLLAPLRARALLEPPASLFVGLPGCAP